MKWRRAAALRTCQGIVIAAGLYFVYIFQIRSEKYPIITWKIRLAPSLHKVNFQPIMGAS